MSVTRNPQSERGSSSRLVLRIFRAVDDIDQSHRYLDGHRERLSSHTIENLHSANGKWIDNPFVWVVAIQDAGSGRLVAGCRLHLADEGYPLPMVEALESRDGRVYGRIHVQYPGPAAEIAGLWKRSRVSRFMVELVARTIFSLACRLQVHWTWGLAPRHTLPLWRRFGVQVDRYLGNQGSFFYPDERFLSKVLHLNTRSSLTTPFPERKRILELSRMSLGGMVLENGETSIRLEIPQSLVADKHQRDREGSTSLSFVDAEQGDER